MKLEKDFIYVRHELSNHNYIYASQLDFDNYLNYDYWTLINYRVDVSDITKFVQESTLLITYLQFLEIYEREGHPYIIRKNKKDTIINFLKKTRLSDINTEFIDIIFKINERTANDDLIIEFNNKIYKNLVADYFHELYRKTNNIYL